MDVPDTTLFYDFCGKHVIDILSSEDLVVRGRDTHDLTDEIPGVAFALDGDLGAELGGGILQGVDINTLQVFIVEGKTEKVILGAGYLRHHGHVVQHRINGRIMIRAIFVVAEGVCCLWGDQ